MKRYAVSEMFYSVQGEGPRAGTAALFLRLAGCHRHCTRATAGFECDTDHGLRERMTASGIAKALRWHSRTCGWVVVTGGEPALQWDRELQVALCRVGLRVAMETSGERPLAVWPDYLAVSSKRGATLALRGADEVRVVLGPQEAPPAFGPEWGWRCVSPRFRGSRADWSAMRWCIEWVAAHPEWRLSVQLHKLLGVR